ncbi:TetR/AcrR family transcriptional regulator [Saccharopolyspora sp. CA-218241]|uniref:TetR/AcrR family transcriptional regulator n=1 Tax=Saccharopolyspora sp. CA-218241 TaxID=3240027 RepID=UPI003D98735E
MVRTIDSEARRRVLADAVWRLIRQGGLEAASVRAVAAETGLSAGSVRHFFATQDELHVFAMEELLRRMTARVEDTLGADAAEGPASPARARARVRAALLDLLPTTAESAADFHAHLQFIVKAVVHRPLEPTARRVHEELQRFYERCLDHLVLTGAARADLDPTAAAGELAVVMDGLVLRRLTAPELLGVERMFDVLDGHLRGLAPAREAS